MTSKVSPLPTNALPLTIASIIDNIYNETFKLYHEDVNFFEKYVNIGSLLEIIEYVDGLVTLKQHDIYLRKSPYAMRDDLIDLHIQITALLKYRFRFESIQSVKFIALDDLHKMYLIEKDAWTRFGIAGLFVQMGYESRKMKHVKPPPQGDTKINDILIKILNYCTIIILLIDT